MTLIPDIQPSVREQIMRYLRTALGGLFTSDNRPVQALRTVLDKIPQDELPLFNLTIENDNPTDQTASDEMIEHRLMVNVDCLVSADQTEEDTVSPSRSIDEIADPLTVWAESKIMEDETFGGLAIRCDWSGSRWTAVPEDLDLLGVRKQFAIMYYSERLDPTQ